MIFFPFFFVLDSLRSTTVREKKAEHSGRNLVSCICKRVSWRENITAVLYDCPTEHIQVW